MREFLKESKGWKLNDTQHREIVFDYNIKAAKHILVRVYSGITKESGQSRKVGKDAIRVCAVDLAKSKGFIKSARVYRVEGWRDNLKNRVIEVIQNAEKRLRENNLNKV